MAPRHRAPSPEQTPGILSNVLGFVARELESFVTTAVGSDPKVQERTRPRPSSSRVKIDPETAGKRRRMDIAPIRDRRAGSQVESEDDVGVKTGRSRRPRRARVDSDPETPQVRRSRKKTLSRAVSQSPTPARRMAADADDGVASSSRDYTVPMPSSPCSRTPSPTPPPLPPLLTATEAVTMPGSLFPRSESLIPDWPPTPEVQDRRVGWLPRTPSPTPLTPKPVKKALPPAPKSDKAKGKERARDTSGELHVRGKERELRAAREAHARKEPGSDDDEREYDRQRIRILEDEIARLRAQLAERSETSFAMNPPPPPPPPPPTVNLFNAPWTPTVARANSFLASARASLKPTAQPVEAPINVATSRTRRAGHPTVNVPTDKMAAFLNEMKTVRLRKVGTRDSDSKSMPPPRYIPGERSFSAVESMIGEKRKRESLYVDDTVPGPSKKRNMTFLVPSKHSGSTTSFQSSQSSQSSQTSRSSQSSQSSQSSNSSVFLPPQDHAVPRGWPSIARTETDITTPSLCSDNENEQDVDDRLPPTPPHDRIHRSPSGPSRSRGPIPEDEIIDVDAVYPESEPMTQRQSRVAPPANEKEKTPPFVDFFARRPPKSPMPPTPVRTVRAPGRKRPKPPPAPAIIGEASDGEDPLSMSMPEIGRAGSTPHPARGRERSRARTSSTASRGTSVLPANNSKAADAAPNRMRRRRTLDEELRRAGDKLWDPDALSEGELADGLDAGELVAFGTASKKKGFLKGGGGAGIPVFMGVGHVQGAEDDGDDEDDDDSPEPVSRRRNGTKARERVE